MRFGIFYEHQLPRPWVERSEADILRDALEQVELADRLGFDYVWAVEHHFLEEYSHSSAPEVFLAAASQRTRRIRLGHGIVNVLPAVNHPARVAERLATLDLVSEGRVEFGTGESSSAAELGGFTVDRERKRAMWHEAVDAITRMFVETPFAGVEGDYVHMPPRNVIPKPLQQPHPPLWVACSRRETIHFAARCGIGALSFSFVEPEDAAHWVTEYYDLLASEECVPAGYAVNPAIAVVLPMMLARDEAQAIERGIDGAHFFGYSLAHYYGGAVPHVPGETDIWRRFLAERDASGFARWMVRPDEAPLAVRLLQEGIGSLRGAIGTPDQVRDLCRRYQAAGVDQMIFVLQAGSNRHEHICESLELFAAEVMPAFAEGREAAEADKAQRLADAVERALARRPPPVTMAAPYTVDEHAELAHGRSATEIVRSLDPRGAPGYALSTGRRLARDGVTKLMARLVDGAADAELERRFGSALVQRLLIEAMARSFVPEAAAGFRGTLAYELTRPATGGEAGRWTIEVGPERAVVRAGEPADVTPPAVRVSFQLSDFVRIAAGKIDPAEPLLHNRASFTGDLALAARLPEMFGAPSPY
jgi:alkanesulfonate monooxygenase SsuD/methylene tetrahydromethanopterin reductase-like flavin-dependent oxidoreductase (luciferase family)